MNCRHCQQPLSALFLDLGHAPPSNAYLKQEALAQPEVCFPLRVRVCQHCWLVQTEDYSSADQLFDDEYAYFSSTSSSWLAHAREFAAMAINRFELDKHSLVIEVASNDGYLLRNFVQADIPCLGIEPTASTAAAAEAQGVPVWRTFFTEDNARRLALKGRQADLIIGNNVYAHVPDINDFTRGLKHALKPEGSITLEFPHLLRLIEGGQFDTVYHEHYSYLSLFVVSRIFESCALQVVDVEELPTHGGSLRIHGRHARPGQSPSAAVARILREEADGGLQRLEIYEGFQRRACQIKDDLLAFLIQQKRLGKRVFAYGAAAKGNTLLNFAGIKPDLLPFVCDAAAAKQGKYLPGSHIPVLAPQALLESEPDFVLILPWNIATEVRARLSALTQRGCRFVTAVPKLEVS